MYCAPGILNNQVIIEPISIVCSNIIDCSHRNNFLVMRTSETWLLFFMFRFWICWLVSFFSQNQILFIFSRLCSHGNKKFTLPCHFRFFSRGPSIYRLAYVNINLLCFSGIQIFTLENYYEIPQSLVPKSQWNFKIYNN